MKFYQPRKFSQSGMAHYVVPGILLFIFCVLGYYTVTRIHADSITSSIASSATSAGSSTGSGSFGTATAGSDDASATTGSQVTGSSVVGSDNTGSATFGVDPISESAMTVNEAAHVYCAVQGTYPVKGGTVQYFLNPDRYGGGTMCMKNTDGKADFSVVSGGKVKPYNGNVQAYPDIIYGCTSKACTSGTKPKLVSSVSNPRTSMKVKTIKSGMYDVAYDLWFSKGSAKGDANAVEILIMLNHRDLNHATVHIVKIDGVNWNTYSYTQHAGSKSWKFIVYRKVSLSNSVSNLALSPFFKNAEGVSGGLKSSYYWSAIDGGFEIWRGGLGLDMESFSASGL